MKRFTLLLLALSTVVACANGDVSAEDGVHPAAPTDPAASNNTGAPPPSAQGPSAETTPLPLPPSGKYMGATPVSGGIEFRVWAPNAKTVAVVGEAAGPGAAARVELASEPGGLFARRIDGAHAGQKYRYEITTADGRKLLRLDPRGRAIDGAESVVVDPRTYAWASKTPFVPAPRESTVLYEMHVSSFNAPSGVVGSGTFATAMSKLDTLVDLGVNAIELMPVDTHGTKHGWGYNPQSYFAPHASYGTPDALRAFVDAAHTRGIAVLVDVVFNHYDSSSSAPLRCFDGGQCAPTANGTSGGDNAGIYFFDVDPYKKTPWGPRPAYAKKEVSDFFADAVFAWMTEFRIDGFRYDSVSNIRAVDGSGSTPGGTELLRRLNDIALAQQPKALLIAEDFKGYAPVTTPTSTPGGLGFHSQWEGLFGTALTNAAAATSDSARNLSAIRDALLGSFNGDPFARLIYTETHDTAGNSGGRLPTRIDGADPTSASARRRTMLSAGLLLTTPGVPMLFMGQEMLESAQFATSPPSLDWTKATTFAPVRTFHRDLLRLRRNADGHSAALLGKNITVTHFNDNGDTKVIAYRRWNVPGDDVMVIANFSSINYPRYDLGLPAGGAWVARVDGNDVRYGADFGASAPTTVAVVSQARDGMPFMGTIALGPYSIVVLTR